MKKIAWYFVFVFGIISSVNGQNLTIDFQHLYSKDGLSSNTIYALCRDSFGFLWIGTEDGLNRFDGSNFKIYRRNPNESDGLGVNHVTSLYEDRKGRIWIGTNGGGVAYYDRNTDRIQHYKPNNVEGVSTAINSIAGDAQGNIWVSAYGSIYCIDVETTAVLTKAAYQKISKQLRDRISSYTFKDKNENLWIASDQMIYRYDPQLKLESVYKLPSEGGARRSDPLVRGIVEDGNGFMWFVSTEGLFRLDEHRTKLQSSAYLLKDQQMHSNNLYAVDVDKSGNLWIGSDKGLHILDINTFKLDYYRPNRSNLYSLSTRSIRSILIDDFGISWVGTYQGGLNKYDNNLNEFNLRTVAGGQLYAGESAIVTSLAASRNQIYIGTDGKGVLAYNKTTGNQEQIGNLPKELAVLAMEPDNQILWIGTYRNGLYGYNLETKGYHHVVAGTAQNQLNNDEIFALKKDRKGNLWIGTNGGGVNVLSPDRKSVLKYESLRYVRAIEEVSEEQIWVGTYGTGISIINPATRELRSINAQSHHLPSNYILSIHRDRIGNIWVGTNGDGVGILKKGDSKFQTISINDGLLNGVVQKIIEDDDGKMWFSTGQGLSCYDIASKSFKNYSHSSGLQAGSFSLGAGIKMSDGELYFGGQQGFNYFYPQNLKTNQNPAQVVLTNLRINNTIVNPGKDQPIATSMLLEKQIRLRHDQNFSISFEALNFTVPEDNQYAYFLDGFDKSWMAVGKEHTASYTNIPPGRYQFRVRASNNDGVWDQNERSIEVLIAPPWWKTVYAYCAYLIVGIGSLLLIRARGIQKLKAQFALEQERATAKQLISQERKEAEQLRQLDKMKIKFLTNLSHEFRTPISLIKGPVDNMLRQIEGGKMAEQLKLVKRNSERLLSLVNQLLDFRKMEENEITLQNSDGEFVAFVKQSVFSFHDLAMQKGIDLSVSSSCEQMYVSFDKDKVERILFNLLSNAFKFTPSGGKISVTIDCAHSMTDASIVELILAVKDTGIGIPLSYQTKIFESFFQLDDQEQVLNQGSGIGLSIVKSFVELYNGIIQVTSSEGKGSVFVFNIQLMRCPIFDTSILETEQPEITEAVKTTAPFEAPKIVIVEDDTDFRTYLKEHLADQYQIIEADNGKDGWQKALFHHPDIIISDVQMPVMTGIELAQKLHHDKRTNQIPVILLTAATVPNGAIYGLESGAIDYINKPFDMDHLKAKIDSLLTLNQVFKDKYSKQLSIVAPEIEVVSEQEKFLQKALNYIEENITNPQLSVESLSENLSISRASLYNKLLAYTGMTPVEFIRSTKLDKAKKLLDKSDKSIAEIAYEMGFASPNYFSKVFKSKFKRTPSEYIHARKVARIVPVK